MKHNKWLFCLKQAMGLSTALFLTSLVSVIFAEPSDSQTSPLEVGDNSTE